MIEQTEFNLGLESDGKKVTPVAPLNIEKIFCQYCEDSGFCTYCERGKKEIEEVGEAKRKTSKIKIKE
jgi:hypothetical protein